MNNPTNSKHSNFSKGKKSKKKQRNYYQDHFGTEKQENRRSNVSKKKYSNAQVNKLRTLIELQNKGNNRKFFCIKVDGEVVVPKTNHPNRFDDFIQFVDQGTESVEIHLYHGHSNNCNKHILYFGEEEKSLNGVSPDQVNEIVKNAINEERKTAYLSQLEKEIEDLEEKNEALEELVEELKKKTDFSELGSLAKAGISAWITSQGGKPPTLGEAPKTTSDTEVTVEGVDEEKNFSEDSEENKAIEKILRLVSKYDTHSALIMVHYAEMLLVNPKVRKEGMALLKKYGMKKKKESEQKDQSEQSSNQE